MEKMQSRRKQARDERNTKDYSNGEPNKMKGEVHERRFCTRTPEECGRAHDKIRLKPSTACKGADAGKNMMKTNKIE